MFVEQLTLVTCEDRCKDTTLSVKACSIPHFILAEGSMFYSKRLHQFLQRHWTKPTIPQCPVHPMAPVTSYHCPSAHTILLCKFPSPKHLSQFMVQERKGDEGSKLPIRGRLLSILCSRLRGLPSWNVMCIAKWDTDSSTALNLDCTGQSWHTSIINVLNQKETLSYQTPICPLWPLSIPIKQLMSSFYKEKSSVCLRLIKEQNTGITL